jgi:hypothetical protein
MISRINISFFKVLLMFIAVGFNHMVFAVGYLLPLQMTSKTGAVIKEMQIDLGDRFSGEDFFVRFNFPYKFRRFTDSSAVALELGSCALSSGKIRRISARISGSESTMVRDIANGFSVDLAVSVDEDAEGTLACRGAELRDLTTGDTLSEVQIIGFFRRKPKWVTRFGHCGHEVEFSFDQKLAAHSPASPVDSVPAEIKLLNAVSYPAGSIYAAPKNCRIGKTSFDSKYLVLRINNREVADGEVWNISCSCFHAVTMRIRSDALMGDKHGNVVCDLAGGLTYTY